MEKAPDAFRTISEVAEEINVPQHVLRFWESRFAQIRPMKRGGGRRYYRPDDVAVLRQVRLHRSTAPATSAIRGVQRILREEGIAFVQDVWRAGSEPPPPETDEDGTEDVGAEAGARGAAQEAARQSQAMLTCACCRPRGSAIGQKRRGPPRRREPEPSTSADADRYGLPARSGASCRRFSTSRIDCRRLIDAALAENYAEDGTGRGGEI